MLLENSLISQHYNKGNQMVTKKFQMSPPKTNLMENITPFLQPQKLRNKLKK